MLSLLTAWVWSLVGALRTHKPSSVAKREKPTPKRKTEGNPFCNTACLEKPALETKGDVQRKAHSPTGQLHFNPVTSNIWDEGDAYWLSNRKKPSVVPLVAQPTETVVTQPMRGLFLQKDLLITAPSPGLPASPSPHAAQKGLRALILWVACAWPVCCQIALGYSQSHVLDTITGYY